MAILQNTTEVFTDGETVTSTKLNNLIASSTFASGAVDTTTIALTDGKMSLASNAVGTANIVDNAVTPAKVNSTTTTQWDLDNLKVKKAQLDAYEPGAKNGALTLDLDDGNFQVIPLDGDITSVAALANQVAGKTFTIIIKNRGTHTMSSWDSTWKWYGGTTPSLTATEDSVDIISGVSDGTNAYVVMTKGYA